MSIIIICDTPIDYSPLILLLLCFSGLKIYDIQYRYQAFVGACTALFVSLIVSLLTGKALYN